MKKDSHPEFSTPSGHKEPDSGASRGELLPANKQLRFLDSSGEFACPHCGDTIRLEGIGLRFEGSGEAETVRLDLKHPQEPLDEVVDDVRRVLVLRALREANGVKVKAAEIAGMKYTTFYELVRRLGITNDDLT